MFKLQLTSRARKQLKEISEVYDKIALIRALDEIKDDPLLGKPLSQEYFGMFSHKIGVYRIIYKINKKDNKVTILKVGHRSTVYQ